MTAQKYFYSLTLERGPTLIFHIREDGNFQSFRLIRREEGSIGALAPLIRYLKKPRWVRERQKAIGLINEQNNNVARVACFFVHFFVIPAQ